MAALSNIEVGDVQDTPASYLHKFYTKQDLKMVLENAFAPRNHKIYTSHIYDKFILNLSHRICL